MEQSYIFGNFEGIEPPKLPEAPSPPYSRSFDAIGCENPSVDGGDSREHVELMANR
jgi:hypothetical protein